jgi:hypothetical protein
MAQTSDHTAPTPLEALEAAVATLRAHVDAQQHDGFISAGAVLEPFQLEGTGCPGLLQVTTEACRLLGDLDLLVLEALRGILTANQDQEDYVGDEKLVAGWEGRHNLKRQTSREDLVLALEVHLILDSLQERIVQAKQPVVKAATSAA